jgi:hypothetical protein
MFMITQTCLYYHKPRSFCLITSYAAEDNFIDEVIPVKNFVSAGFLKFLMKFLMKYGIGGPGSIAKAMAKTYCSIRRVSHDNETEKNILSKLYLSRVYAASKWGKAEEYGYSDNPLHVDQVIIDNPDLPSLMMHVIISEHPELLGPDLPEAKWDALDEVIDEIVNKFVPDWQQRRNFRTE